MFATCSATKVSMAPSTLDLKILRKTGISKKNRFLHQNEVCSKYRKKSLFNENNTLSHTKSCKLNLHSSKRHTDTAKKKRTTLWEAKNGSKVPHRQRIVCSKMCVSSEQIRLSLWDFHSWVPRHHFWRQNVDFYFLVKSSVFCKFKNDFFYFKNSYWKHSFKALFYRNIQRYFDIFCGFCLYTRPKFVYMEICTMWPLNYFVEYI